jgi:hypothetical protein
MKMTFQEIRIIATGPCIANQLRDVNTICRRSWYIAAHISQLIRYARASGNYSDFLKRHLHLRNRLLDQGYKKIRLIRSLKKFIDADEAVSVVSLTSSSGGYINGRNSANQELLIDKTSSRDFFSINISLKIFVSNGKTYRRDISEIELQVALSTITLTKHHNISLIL